MCDAPAGDTFNAAFFSGKFRTNNQPPVPSEVVDKLAAFDGRALPEVYPGDRIKLMAQSPENFTLLGLEQNPFATLVRAFGPQAAGYSLVLRLVNTETAMVLHLASRQNRNGSMGNPATPIAYLGL